MRTIRRLLNSPTPILVIARPYAAVLFRGEDGQPYVQLCTVDRHGLPAPSCAGGGRLATLRYDTLRLAFAGVVAGWCPALEFELAHEIQELRRAGRAAEVP